MTPFDVTPETDFDRTLSAWLDARAQPTAPENLLGETLVRTRQTRPRSAWRIPERWIPMTLLTTRTAVAPPSRAVWTLLLIGLLTVALVASLVIVGSQLQRQLDPNRFSAGLMVPTLALDFTWDATTVPGLNGPSGMDIGPDGNLYVVNAGASEIIVLSPDGNIVHRWGSRGSGESQFEFHPYQDDPEYTIGGVGVGPDGSVYVVDSGNDRVQQFDADGVFVRQWGGFGGGDGRFLDPFDAEVDDDGQVYVVDLQRSDIQVFSADGTFDRTIGSPRNPVPASSLNTGSIQVGADGTIFNADFGNGRVQAFGGNGSPLWSMGAGVGPVTFDSPGDLALDRDGNLFVSDMAGIRAFDGGRAVTASWSIPDPDPDAVWYTLALAADGWAYLAPSGPRDRIYRLRVGSAEAPEDVESTTLPSPAPSQAAGSPAPSSAAAEASTKLRMAEAFAVPLTFDLPPGWERSDERRGLAQVQKPGEPGAWDAYVTAVLPLDVHPDPCHLDAERTPSVGSTVEELTEALTQLVGFRSGPVTDISIDGHSGKAFDLEEMVGLDLASCSDGTWLQQLTYDGALEGGARPTDLGVGKGVGWHQRFAIVDVDGTPVVLQTWTFRNTSRDVVEEAFQVLESIDFG